MYFILAVFVFMHVPTGAIVARSIALPTPRPNLYAVKNEARIATCTLSWGEKGVVRLLHQPAQRLVLFVQPFQFIFVAAPSFFPSCLAAARSANSAPNHSARWITTNANG